MKSLTIAGYHRVSRLSGVSRLGVGIVDGSSCVRLLWPPPLFSIMPLSIPSPRVSFCVYSEASTDGDTYH